MRRTLFAIGVLFCSLARSQQFFYDANRDKQASDAAAAAKEVSSSSVYQTMQRNAVRQTQIELRMADRWQAGLGLTSFYFVETWNVPGERATPAIPLPAVGRPAEISICMEKSVWGSPDLSRCQSLKCRVLALQQQFHVQEALDRDAKEIKERLDAVEKEAAELRKAREKIQQSTAAKNDRFLGPLLQQLENGQTLLDQAKRLSDATGANIAGRFQALKEIESALKQIKEWTTTLQTIWDGYQAIQQAPRDLLSVHEQLDLDLVMVEQERLQQQGLIYARLHQDAGQIRNRLQMAINLLCPQSSVESCPLLNSHDSIEATLAALTREARSSGRQDRLELVIRGLFELSSAMVQGGIGLQLCSLREGAANRAAAIRKSAVSAQATERAVAEATQRLALYYKSGITPSQLATLAFSLASGIAAPLAVAK